MNWITQGAAGLTAGIAGLPEREARIKEAKLKQQLAQQQLNEFETRKPERDIQMENSIAKLRTENEMLNKQHVNNITRFAIERYDADGDVRHLNTMFADLQSTEYGNKMFGNVTKITPLVRSSENDQLLRGMGYQDVEGMYDMPGVKKNLLPATGKNGEYAIWDLDKFKAMTGYTKYATKEKMEVMEKQAQINLLLKQGEKAASVNAMQAAVQDLTGRGVPAYEAWNMVLNQQEEAKAKNRGDNYAYNQVSKNPDFANIISKVNEANRTETKDEVIIKTIAEEQGIKITEAAKMWADIQHRTTGKPSVYTVDDNIINKQREITDAETKKSGDIIAAEDLVKRGQADTLADAQSMLNLANSSKLTNQQQYVQTKRNEAIANGEQPRNDSEYVKEFKNLYSTSAQKNIEATDKVYVELDKLNWLNSSDAEDTKGKTNVYRDHISKLEELKNFKLSEEEKRKLRGIGDLIQLGGQAGKDLTPAQTGLIDNMLGGVKKYLFDNVDGVAAKSAYATFSNTIRNALYGSSLTKNEEALYDKAAGTLNQQYGPVLEQLKVQLGTIRNQLEGFNNTMDPYIARYYTGVPEVKLDQAIQGIDERLNYLGGLKINKSVSGKDVKIKLPQTGSNTEFDFDSAMKEAGL